MKTFLFQPKPKQIVFRYRTKTKKFCFQAKSKYFFFGLRAKSKTICFRPQALSAILKCKSCTLKLPFFTDRKLFTKNLQLPSWPRGEKIKPSRKNFPVGPLIKKKRFFRLHYCGGAFSISSGIIENKKYFYRPYSPSPIYSQLPILYIKQRRRQGRKREPRRSPKPRTQAPRPKPLPSTST